MSFPLLRGPIRVYELIFYASLALPGLYLLGQISDAETRGVLTQAGGWSLLAFLSAFLLIPALSSRFMLRGLKGKDMGRRGTPLESVEIPSAVGLVCAVVFLVCVISTQLWWAKGRGSSAGNNDFVRGAGFTVCARAREGLGKLLTYLSSPASYLPPPPRSPTPLPACLVQCRLAVYMLHDPAGVCG